MTAPLARTPPQLTRWRYHFTDFRLGRLLTTLDLSDVALSDVLSDAADGSAIVPLSSSAIRNHDPFSATVPRRSCMWAERQVLDYRTGSVTQSTVPWAGIVMRRERSLASREMKLGLVTFASYFQRRLVGDAIYRQVDKFTIFRAVIDHLASQPNVDTADPGVYGDSPHLYPITSPPPDAPLSGVLADRTYLGTDLKPGLDALRELSSSGSGFDWRLVPYMATPGDLRTFRLRLDLGYPRLGRVAPEDLRWSSLKSDDRSRWGFLTDLTITEDGSAVDNQITAVGGGNGTDQIRVTAQSGDEMAAGYPLYESSLGSATSEDRTLDTVQGKAYGALAAGLQSQVTLDGIKVRGDLAPVLPSWELGDDATVEAADTTTGLNETFVGQIVGRTIRPAEPGRTEEITMDVRGTRVG